jgi:uncharacterized protein (TIRG00374 family)
MKSWLVVIKVAVSLVLIGWVVSKADLAAIGQVLSAASLPMVALAALAHLVSFGMLNMRWWLLLDCIQPGLRFRETVAAFWLGLFGNNLLPSGMGGDVLRIVQMRSEQVSGRSLLASVLMDRVTGLIGVLLIGLAALLIMTGDLLPAWNQWLIIALLVAIPLGILIFFSAPLVRFLAHLEQRFSRHRPLQLAIHTLQRLQAYRNAVPRLFLALAMTVVLQSLVALSYVFLGFALQSQVSVGAYFLAIPILFIAVSLPISVGGLGVREGVFVALMSGLGMAEQKAIGVSVLYLAVILVLTLPGGLVMARQRRTGKSAPIE